MRNKFKKAKQMPDKNINASERPEEQALQRSIDINYTRFLIIKDAKSAGKHTIGLVVNDLIAKINEFAMIQGALSPEMQNKKERLVAWRDLHLKPQRQRTEDKLVIRPQEQRVEDDLTIPKAEEEMSVRARLVLARQRLEQIGTAATRKKIASIEATA